MAGVAAHTLIHVDAVIEIHEVRHLVDARPLDRLARAVAFTHRLEVRGVRPDLRMAVHAGLGRRDAGKARLLDRSMAIAAVDPQSGD